MNPYSINALQKKYSIKPVCYEYSTNLHKEDLSIYFIDSNNAKETYNFVSNGILYQSWMSILDFNDANNNDTSKVFHNLKLTLELLQINTTENINNYETILATFDDVSCLNILSQVFGMLKECFELRPALSYLYPKFYWFLVRFYTYFKENENDEKIIAEMKKVALTLFNEITSLPSVYESAREYIKQVLITPFEQKIKLPMHEVAFLYQTYCSQNQRENFYSQSYISLENTEATEISDKNWREFLEKINKTFPKNKTSYFISSFQQFCYIGINLMLTNDMNLRKCKNCGGYFCVKYTSNQECCNRIYSAASTCSEYTSRKTYKDKLFEHAISSEYTKAYNKLYARIRRKKLPPDTPLKEELLKLREEYMERYEQTHKKDRDAVWKEYIQKNKELLG